MKAISWASAWLPLATAAALRASRRTSRSGSSSYRRTPIDYDHSLLDDREKRSWPSSIDASRPMRGHLPAPGVREEPVPAPPAHERGGAHGGGRRGRARLFPHQRGPVGPPRGQRPLHRNAGEASRRRLLSREHDEGGVRALGRRAPGGRKAASRASSPSSAATARASSPSRTRRNTAALLEAIAAHLRDAAALTGNASLRTYLGGRADALLSDDYYASDLAWMDLDSDIEVMIGPYEVYEDELFNYKASFDAFVTVRDKAESEKLAVYAKHLPDMEKNLPIPDEHKNSSRKFESPIRVVQEVYHRRRHARRRADVGLQPAQRRARPPGEGLEEGPPEERDGGEVPRRGQADRRARARPCPAPPRFRSTPTSTTRSSTSSRTASGPGSSRAPTARRSRRASS